MRTSLSSTQLRFLGLTLRQRRIKTLGFRVLSLRNRKSNIVFYFYVINSMNKSKLRLFSNENIIVWSIFEKHGFFCSYGHIGCVLEKIYLTPVVYYRIFSVLVKRYSFPHSSNHLSLIN